MMNPLRGRDFAMYAPGTAAVEDKHAYDIHTDRGEYHIWAPSLSRPHGGYRLQFADTKGLLGGGLWHDLGSFRSPQAAKAAASQHYDSLDEGRNPYHGLSISSGNVCDRLTSESLRRSCEAGRHAALASRRVDRPEPHRGFAGIRYNPPSNAFNVYLNGKLIDTVFYQETDPAEVRRSLINHDGYDYRIIVRRYYRSGKAVTKRNPTETEWTGGLPSYLPVVSSHPRRKCHCRPTKVIRWKGKRWGWRGLCQKMGVKAALKKWHHSRKLLNAPKRSGR